MNDISQDLINPDDFKSIELNISMMNVTTRTEIRDGMRIYGGTQQKSSEDLSIRLIEILEHELGLEVPENACAAGHNLLLHISAENCGTLLPRVESKKDKEVTSWSATAKVLRVEVVEKGRSRINVDLVQYDEESWKHFFSLFTRRQKEIEEFFRAVKGE